MKKQFLIASTAAVMTMASVGAIAAEASANIAFTTDYRFRGISQTDRDFALQGGFDYAWDSGLYVGTWASNVDGFNSNPYTGDSGAQAELDFYGGYGFDITDSVAFDFNVLYFYYPGASTAGDLDDNPAGNNEIDYWEFTPGISYSGDNMSAALSVSYSNDFFYESGDAFYYNTNFEFPLEEWLTLGVHAGYQTIDDNELFGTPDYADWSVSLTTSMFGLDWSVAYVDTDLSYDECFGGDNLCGATAVGTVAKSF